MTKTQNKSEKDQVKVRINAHNLAGKYRLPYNFGQVVSLEAKQAKELIEAGDAIDHKAFLESEKENAEAEKKAAEDTAE